MAKESVKKVKKDEEKKVTKTTKASSSSKSKEKVSTTKKAATKKADTSTKKSTVSKKETAVEKKVSTKKEPASKKTSKKTPSDKKDASTKKSTASKKVSAVEKKVSEKKEPTSKKTSKKTPSDKKDASTKKSTASKKDSAVEKKVSEKKDPASKKTLKKTTSNKKDVSTKKSSASKKVPAVEKKVSEKKEPTSKKTSKKTSTDKKVASTTKKSSVNSRTKTTAKPMLAEYYDLPYRYNETVVKILAQTPTTLFVYWDISDDDRNKLLSIHGENMFYETRPILIIHNTTKNYSFEVEINDFANSWYIRTQEPDCNYVIELGRRVIQKPEEYIYINSSNNMTSPNNHILFERTDLGNVLFRNVKTNVLSSRNFGSLRFINDIDKLYGNLYDVYSRLYKDETLNELTMPSSGEFINK